MEWFASKGAHIVVPVGHSPDYDFIADLGDRLLRVQVKTCIAFRKGRWEVKVCTRGGNQSWNGIVKRLDPSQCDFLFVVVGDGRRWAIPSSAVEGGTGIRLGGPKSPSLRSNPVGPCRGLRRSATPLQSSGLTLGGMSEWPKESGCKPLGTAYAGSNPAPPTPAD
jgi:hypothetical protein